MPRIPTEPRTPRSPTSPRSPASSPPEPRIAPGAGPASSRGRGRGRGVGGRLWPLPARSPGSCSLEPGRNVTPDPERGGQGQPPAESASGRRSASGSPRTQGRRGVSAVYPFSVPSSIISARRALQRPRHRGGFALGSGGRGGSTHGGGGEEKLKSRQLHSVSAPGNPGWEQPKASLRLPGAFPSSLAWKLHLSQGTAMPEECQITSREVSNLCGLSREINQGRIHGIPDRNPRMGSCDTLSPVYCSDRDLSLWALSPPSWQSATPCILLTLESSSHWCWD